MRALIGDERGSAAISATLSLVVVATVVFMTIQFAIVAYYLLVIDAAAADGARAAAVGGDFAAAEARTEALLVDVLGEPGRNFSVSATGGGGFATVTVSGPYQLVLVPRVGTLTLTRTRQMTLTGASP